MRERLRKRMRERMTLQLHISVECDNDCVNELKKNRGTDIYLKYNELILYIPFLGSGVGLSLCTR